MEFWGPLESLLCFITSVVSALLITKHMGTHIYVSPCYMEQIICLLLTSAQADFYPLSSYKPDFRFSL